MRDDALTRFEGEFPVVEGNVDLVWLEGDKVGDPCNFLVSGVATRDGAGRSGRPDVLAVEEPLAGSTTGRPRPASEDP